MDELGNFTLLQVFLIIIIPAIISGIPAFLAVLQQQKPKPKDKYDQKEQDSTSADKIATAYERIVEDLQNRFDKVEAKLTKSEVNWTHVEKEWIERQEMTDLRLEHQGRRIRILERGIQQLIGQIEDLGAIPVFKFPEDDQKDTNV